MTESTVLKVCHLCNGPLLCPKCGYCINCYPLHGDGYAGTLYDALGTVEYLWGGPHFVNHTAVTALLRVAHLALQRVLDLTKHSAEIDGLPPRRRLD